MDETLLSTQPAHGLLPYCSPHVSAIVTTVTAPKHEPDLMESQPDPTEAQPGPMELDDTLSGASEQTIHLPKRPASFPEELIPSSKRQMLSSEELMPSSNRSVPSPGVFIPPPVITICSGSSASQQRFEFDGNQLCLHSAYFQRAFEDRPDKTAFELPSQRPKTVELLHTWFTQHRLPPIESHEDSLEVEKKYYLLYYIASSLVIPKLKNELMDIIRSFRRTLQAAIEPVLVIEAAQKIEEGSTLGQYLLYSALHTVCHTSYGQQYIKDLREKAATTKNPENFLTFIQGIEDHSRTVIESKMGVNDPNEGHPCRFHEVCLNGQPCCEGAGTGEPCIARQRWPAEVNIYTDRWQTVGSKDPRKVQQED